MNRNATATMVREVSSVEYRDKSLMGFNSKTLASKTFTYV